MSLSLSLYEILFEPWQFLQCKPFHRLLPPKSIFSTFSYLPYLVQHTSLNSLPTATYGYDYLKHPFDKKYSIRRRAALPRYQRFQTLNYNQTKHKLQHPLYFLKNMFVAGEKEKHQSKFVFNISFLSSKATNFQKKKRTHLVK